MVLGQEVGGHALGGAELAADDHGGDFGRARDQDLDRIFVLLEILLLDELAAEGDEEVIPRRGLARRELDHALGEAQDLCRPAAGLFEELGRGMRGGRLVGLHEASRELVDEVVHGLLVLADDDELTVHRDRHDGEPGALGELRVLLDLAGLGVDEVLGDEGQAMLLCQHAWLVLLCPLGQVGVDDGSQMKVLRFLRRNAGGWSQQDFWGFVNPLRG